MAISAPLIACRKCCSSCAAKVCRFNGSSGSRITQRAWPSTVRSSAAEGSTQMSASARATEQRMADASSKPLSIARLFVARALAPFREASYTWRRTDLRPDPSPR